MSPTLPGFALVFLLSIACSRRVPALRPVAACFAAWALADAVTGPLWLRAGVCVAWPGAAAVAGLWGLKDEGPGSPYRESGPRPRTANVRRRHYRATLPHFAAAVYLLAGCVAALCYALGYRQPYHLALPLSRATALPFAARVLLARPWRLPWATRACVVPLLGLACGAVLGVWTLLPAGLDVVREQWAQLAGAETLVTMVATCGCVVAAWQEARTNRP